MSVLVGIVSKGQIADPVLKVLQINNVSIVICPGDLVTSFLYMFQVATVGLLMVRVP